MKKLFKAVALLVVLAVLSPMTVIYASASNIQSNDKAAVDITNMNDGYIKVTYKGTDSPKMKVLIQTPTKVQYQYNFSSGSEGEIFPLTEGDGKYSVGVYTNTSGSKYATTFTASFDVKLKNTYAPFLVPSQYVNYTEKSETVKKAAELVKNCKTDLDKVAAVYDYVIEFKYDKEKANTVQSGYLPDVDKILSSKKGICFDYAAVMTAMLRSQGVPCQLVVGYAGEVYHAWINVYTSETGWIEGFIQFDGKNWSRMDPTFDSTGGSSSSVQSFIGDGKNYSAKYYY